MKKLPLIVIGTIDVVLLMVILISVVTGWRIGVPKTQSNESDAYQTLYESKGSDFEADPVRPSETTDGNPDTQLIMNDLGTDDSGPASFRPNEASDNDSDTEPEQKPSEKPTEIPTETPTQIPTEVPKLSYPSPDEITTEDGPSLWDVQGFLWNKNDGAYWDLLTSSAVKLTEFDAVTGGWKAYLLDDPSGKINQNSTEHFANIRISGSTLVAKTVIDWIYATSTDEGDGYDDTSPDSVFNGSWSDGAFSGLGPGKLTLSDFYYENGREYAVGTYMWPDGIESIIALTRP